MNVPPIRLPRVPLVKLQSDDPGLRRPAIDQLGDSMGRYGGVRLLGVSAACEMEDEEVLALGELMLVSIEAYFGLRAGLLPGLSAFKTRTSLPAPLSKPVEDTSPAIVAKWIPSRPEDSGTKIELRLPNGGLAHWESRPTESLLLVGPRLATWTAGVWPPAARVDGAVAEPARIGLWVVARDESSLEPLPGF